VLDFLEGRAELRGLARQHSLSRHLYSGVDSGTRTRPPRAPLGQRPESWPARRITRRPRIQNL
jgi:hypothetical protein